MSRVDVSIIIVCYNSKKDIGPCLESIVERTKCDYEVLLTDCSNDGTVQYVKDRFPWVKIVETEENLGFAKGNNLLASEAVGEFILLLNPDTVVLGQGIDALLNCAQLHPDCSSWGGVTLMEGGQRDFSSAQFGPTLKNAILMAVGLGKLVERPLYPTPEEGDDVHEVAATLSGAFMMTRTNHWIACKGFDTSFFLYCEEVDLCHRLRESTGLPAVLFNQARITHFVGKSSATNYERAIKLHTGYMHFARKFFPSLKVVCYGWTLCLAAIVRLIGSLILYPFLGEKSSAMRTTNWKILLLRRRWWKGWS